MARARTIKPQFLRSDSMRRVSRDAQLTFIRLWLVADDAGRVFIDVHGLGYKLYPGDEEVWPRVAEWLAELEREHCIECYAVDGWYYLRIVNWRRHQRISHPSPSRLPARPPGPAAALPAPLPLEPVPASGTHSGAIHEALGSPHESLRKNGDKPLRSSLFGRFHERFARK